jgi:predicted nucleic acid-binding Zn ribbon protein
MPIYEYKSIDADKGCEFCINIFEIQQKMSDNTLEKCPQCGADIVKIMSLIGGVIMSGKEINQYSDVKGAKYWRDSNGVRHKVTNSDGSSKSPTISNRNSAPQETIKRRKMIDAAKDKRKRRIESYNRAKNAICGK